MMVVGVEIGRRSWETPGSCAVMKAPSHSKSTYAACVVCVAWLAALVIFTSENTADLVWRGTRGWCWEGRLLYG